MQSESSFEAGRLLGTSIRDLGLTIEGTDLEPVIAAFRRELAQAGIHRLQPYFYLSDEWGVPFETIAIGIPFYLARADLTLLHAERTGHLEGVGRVDLLRYLRHEMGHVVNYAYRLYEQPDWVAQFGAMTQPYLDEYHPEPFSRSFRATPSGLVRTEASRRRLGRDVCGMAYAGPELARRLRAVSDGTRQTRVLRRDHGHRCDRATRSSLRPNVTTTSVSWKTRSQRHYEDESEDDEPLPPGLDGALRSIFEDANADDATAVGCAIARARPDTAVGKPTSSPTCSVGPDTFPNGRDAC